MSELTQRRPIAQTAPRLGFLGAGWIGRHRLEAVVKSGVAEIAAIADPAPEVAAWAGEIAPGAALMMSLEDLLEAEIDGLVIATPSALHAAQAIAALERGVAVFCQKPLGRTAHETRRVIEAARAADRLLAVDFSYRFIAGMEKIFALVHAGELGKIYAADLVFHNAYGPDKAWFYDPALSGGGCVMDLGVHLVDLALWTLDFPRIENITSRLFAQGEPLREDGHTVEDYAVARLDLTSGATARLACSWRLSAGCDAIIEAWFFGTRGGAALRNVDGSFYDFSTEYFRGTARETLSAPPDAWGGRAIVDWVQRLAVDSGFDPASERLVDVAAALDGIYGR